MLCLISALLMLLGICEGIPLSVRNSILKAHNSIRSEVFPTAANMEKMQWDPELASLAQSFTDDCLFVEEYISGVGLISHNDYREHGKLNVSEVIRMWSMQSRWWFPSSSFCVAKSACDEYLQLVWHSASKIGCGYKLCNEISGSSGSLICDDRQGCHYFICYYSQRSAELNSQNLYSSNFCFSFEVELNQKNLRLLISC